MIFMSHAMMGAAGYQAASGGLNVLDYSPGIWLDASDAASITTVSGDVSVLADLSGNNRDLSQGSAGVRPLYNQANNCITFGAGEHLFMTSAPFYANGACAVFCMIEPINTIADSRWLSEGSSANNNPLYCFNQVGKTLSTSASTYVRNDANHTTIIQEDSVYVDGYAPNVKQINYFEDSGSSIVLGKDGAMSSAYAYARAGNLNVDQFCLGGILRVAFCCDMDFHFHELIILMSVPTESEREEIEGYLAHKWGTTASLPADHPYKSSAP